MSLKGLPSQGKLEVEKTISYISPSSYKKSITSPNEFYLQRLCHDRLEYDPQSMPAAVGTAFDLKIKKHLINQYSTMSEKARYMPELLAGIAEEHKDKALQSGTEICRSYVNWGLVKAERWADVELQDTFNYGGIPILVKLDASVWHEDYEIPFDWKVSGYCSQASPAKGFYQKIVKGIPKPAHKLYRPKMQMSEINADWAIQTCMYGWALGRSKDLDFKPFPARLHQLAFTKTGNMTVAKYEGWFSVEYQRDLFNGIKKLWNEINDGSYVKRLICDKYKVNVWSAARFETWF